jgi:hypothetical protein
VGRLNPEEQAEARERVRAAKREHAMRNGQAGNGKNGITKKDAATLTTKPRVIEPYQPFPLDALPPVAKSYVRQGAAALGCDPAFVALPVLAVLASAIGNTRTIRLKPGWTEKAILWTAIVGDSGTLKSPAFDLAVDWLFTIQERLLAEYKRACAEYQNELLDWKQKKKEFDKANRKSGKLTIHREGEEAEGEEAPEDPGEAPEPPVLRRVIVCDTTIEKLAEILEDNPRGTLVARDELAGWIGSFTRYKGKTGGSDVQNWLELHRAGTMMVDRKTGDRRTLFIKRASSSVTGGIQPGVLAKALTSDLIESGLAARLQLCWPPRKPKRWTEAVIDPEREGNFRNLLDRLLKLDFDHNRDGKPVPRLLRLSEEAKAVWVEWYNQWALEQAAVEGELAAAYSKLEAASARFALLHHVISHAVIGSDDAVAVASESIEAGIILARWFAGEARRIYGILSESVEEKDTRRLIDFINSRGGEITPHDLWKSNTRRYSGSEDARLALTALEDAGVGVLLYRPSGPRGGRPTEVFRIFHTRNPETTQKLPGPDGDSGAGAPETPSAEDETAEISDENEVSGGFGVSGAGDEGGESADEVSGRDGVLGCRYGSVSQHREPGEEG